MLSSIIPTRLRPERSQNTLPLGLPSSKDVYHRNNSNDCYQAQATMNNMGMERRCMGKEPDNQSFGRATAKIARKTVAATSTFQRGHEFLYDSDSDPA